MLERIKSQIEEKISNINIWKKYADLKEEWKLQNQFIDNQKSQIQGKEHKLVTLEKSITKLEDDLINQRIHYKELTDTNNQNHKKELSKLNARIEIYQALIQQKDTEIQNKEQLRRKSAGKLGGLTANLNKVLSNNGKLSSMIEDLVKQNNWLRGKLPKTKIVDLESYEAIRGKCEKNNM